MKKQKSKHFLWLPYTSSIAIKGKTVTFHYNSGVEVIGFEKIHSIMFYGEVIDLSQKFLEKCALHNIPIVIHRRNMTRGVFINHSPQTNSKDILTKQIVCRQNLLKRNYIARQLIRTKLKSSSWLVDTKPAVLKKEHSLNQIRAIEAINARHYWKVYFEKLGRPGWIRRGDNPIAKSLDAVSKFVTGIILRWCLYHNLSPYHGYMHVQTEYPALLYDLLDPYRSYFDEVVFNSIKRSQNIGYMSEKWLPSVIVDIKEYLNSKVYTDSTRQIVTVSELMHGIVLALRSYLLGKSHRFIIPIPGKPNGGRPVKTGYSLYGRRAGRTDFWKEVDQLSRSSKSVNV